MCIPKLGNQKFSTLAELLQEQDNLKINVSRSRMFQSGFIILLCSHYLYLILFFLPIAPNLTSMNDSSSLVFTSDQKNIVICSSNYQSDDTQVPVLGEITADQILDMPIVFADTLQEELKQTVDNNSYFIPGTNDHQMMVNEELVDNEDLDIDIMCPISRNTVPERLNIKQVDKYTP